MGRNGTLIGKSATAVTLLGAAMMFGCNGPSETAGNLRDADVRPADQPQVEAFTSGGSEHLTVALKFVNYKDEAGAPVMDENEIIRLTQGMNELLKVCNMHFRVEKVEAVTAEDLGLTYNTSSMGEFEKIRSSFDEDQFLVVINTGAWSMGGAANAWTAMPGTTPSGAIIEGPAAGDAPLVAHELGHYLNLDHSGDPGNMMSPTIYDSSTYISRGQCETMRETAMTVRSGALRAS